MGVEKDNQDTTRDKECKSFRPLKKMCSLHDKLEEINKKNVKIKMEYKNSR